MPEGDFTKRPMTTVRRAIAARVSEAMRTIPHFRLVADLHVGRLIGLRKLVNAERPHEPVSLNDCLLKACATALVAVPEINVQFDGTDILQYQQADLSVVVAVPGGVMTPVVRGADRKSVQAIGLEVRDLAFRATGGRLKLQEMQGGTFSVSNLGGHGVDQFDAIINPPQCAILAVGRAKPAVVVGEAGNPSVATVLRATLSVDHRVVDGSAAAAFLGHLRSVVESPELLFAGSDP
jgi:pyruvate dehydrogenase E2 component (dihydrolipoamide acetyltransferase)